MWLSEYFFWHWSDLAASTVHRHYYLINFVTELKIFVLVDHTIILRGKKRENSEIMNDLNEIYRIFHISKTSLDCDTERFLQWCHIINQPSNSHFTWNCYNYYQAFTLCGLLKNEPFKTENLYCHISNKVISPWL